MSRRILRLALALSALVALAGAFSMGSAWGGRTRPHCFHAEVSRGHRPGAIRVVVSCRGSDAGKEVGFSVRRGGRRPRIEHVGRRPLVLGPEGRRTTGACELTAEGAGCSALARGTVRIAATVWVRPSTVCSRRTEVFIFVHSLCADGKCLNIGVRELVDARPGGC